jgi:signal transduction histidine kinase
MSFERLSTFARSLRFRLTLWNVAAGLLTGLGILVVVREGVRFTLEAELDQVLREDLQEIGLHVSAGDNFDWTGLQAEMDRKARGHAFHGWFVQFYDPSGQPSWASVNTPRLPAPTREQRLARAFVHGDFRLAYADLPRAVPQAAAATVGCSENSIDRDMARIDRLVLVVGGAVLLIVPFAGYVLAGRTTRILADLIRKTEGLRPAELTERLPIRGTGDELDSLAHTINGLLDRIADYLEQKHDFLANAAHELRTPLAAIRSSVEVALSGERSEAEYQELLDDVIEQCSALQSLVNQLLLLSETEGDRSITAAEMVQLDELVRRAIDMFQGVAEFHEIRLSLHAPSPVTVVGSRTHLRQVLNNLLDNAIKFTAARTDAGVDSKARRPGVVEVQLLRDDTAGVASLTVADTGVGIAATDLPHVFDRFFRADKARTREGGPGGTGLGLSICQAIVHTHHGTIQATSSVGTGTTFIVQLPLASKSQLEMASAIRTAE